MESPPTAPNPGHVTDDAVVAEKVSAFLKLLPKELILPEPREFRHPFQLINQPYEEGVRLRLIADSDQNRVQLNIEFFVFPRPDTKPAMLEQGLIDVTLKDGALRPSREVDEVVVISDQQQLRLECTDKRGLGARIRIDQFATLLSAKQLSIQLADVTIPLTQSHIEAMRELGSRLPKGETFAKKFNIYHKPDGGPFEMPAASDPRDDRPKTEPVNQEETAIQEAISGLRKTLLADLAEKIREIQAEKLDLKKAMVHDDAAAIKRLKRLISQSQEAFYQLILNSKNQYMSPDKFQRGMVGKLGVSAASNGMVPFFNMSVFRFWTRKPGLR